MNEKKICVVKFDKQTALDQFTFNRVFINGVDTSHLYLCQHPIQVLFGCPVLISDLNRFNRL